MWPVCIVVLQMQSSKCNSEVGNVPWTLRKDYCLLKILPPCCRSTAGSEVGNGCGWKAHSSVVQTKEQKPDKVFACLVPLRGKNTGFTGSRMQCRGHGQELLVAMKCSTFGSYIDTDILSVLHLIFSSRNAYLLSGQQSGVQTLRNLHRVQLNWTPLVWGQDMFSQNWPKTFLKGVECLHSPWKALGPLCGLDLVLGSLNNKYEPIKYCLLCFLKLFCWASLWSGMSTNYMGCQLAYIGTGMQTCRDGWCSLLISCVKSP